MRKVACNRLIQSDGATLQQVVLVLDKEGRITDYYHFEAEEPFVEWIGGTYSINDKIR